MSALRAFSTPLSVSVRGTTFQLYKTQLDSDAPNYFTRFLEHATQWSLTIHRDPLFFELIVSHLSGYKVLPLPDQMVPKYMGKDLALQNFLEDAKYYGLLRLQRLIQDYIDMRSASGPLPPVDKYYVKVGRYKETYWSEYEEREVTKDTADHLLASAHTDKSLTYSLNAWITIIATLDPKKNESLLGAWRIAVPPDPKLPDELEKIALIKRTVSTEPEIEKAAAEEPSSGPI